jgi:hypothetical protein
MVNSGYGKGFRVCTTCGYADVIDPTSRQRRKEHKNLFSGQYCAGGTFETYHLGHRFMTDVLELRLGFHLHGENGIYSLLYALLGGASDALDIPREDIDAVFFYQDNGPSFVFYDTTPGGSGHVKLIHDHLYQTFESAYRRVSTCDGCGPETSCYSCLRGYRNQFIHDKLERRLAWDILGRVLGKPLH